MHGLNMTATAWRAKSVLCLASALAPMLVAGQGTTETAATKPSAPFNRSEPEALALQAGHSRLAQMPALLGIPSILALEVEGTSEQMSMQQAQWAARNYSAEVEAASQRLLSFEYARSAASGAWLPQVDIQAGSGRGETTSVDPVSRLPRDQVTLTARQALLDEPLRHSWRRSRRLLKSAEFQLEGTVSQVMLESGTAYLEALKLRAGMEFGRAHEAMLDELLRYISTRLDAGAASPAERERVRSRVANLRSGLADTRSSLDAALRNLHRITGRVPAALEAGGEHGASGTLDLSAAVNLALARNPELNAARTEVEAAEVDVAHRRAQQLPRLELEVSRVKSNNVGGTQSRLQDSRVMLNLTMPIYHGGTLQAETAGARARRDELAARARGVERRLVMEVETAFANLRAASQRFVSVRDEIASNTKVVEAFRAQQTSGTRPLLDVLDAYQRLYQSRVDMAQLIASEAQTYLRLAHLTGTLTTSAPGGASPR